ncbi:MAG: hypothetical protein OEX18_15015 [Candidatus Krumholzibacteria bacterium]|nr:hypothetical protein [Candidatus Krumholzibacteria bacterium]MDH4338579.1 hypothetical protein [Candidatus Krumholzibacteria bacterium]MDH5271241.1 hypothetical protein [Candidatus Krumholzibacteria bacterium]
MIHWQEYAAALLLLALPLTTAQVSPAAAQSCEDGSPAAYLDTYVSGQNYFCYLPFDPGVVTLTVVARAIPFQKVRFTLADPPLGVVIGETWAGPTTGNRINGLEVDMGSCTAPGEVTVGTLTVIVTSEDMAPCTSWEIQNCEVQDCTGDWRPAVPVEHRAGTGYCECVCWQCCYYALSPYDLYPPNGATTVPLDVVLSWDGTPDDAIEQPPYGGCSVRISTSPDCTSGTVYPVPCDLDQFAPDFLQPNTTYYWRAQWGTAPSGCTDLNSGASPLYSFTTQGPLATEARTWGYVKSMYR